MSSTLAITAPVNNTSVARPFSVTVSWVIDEQLVEERKRRKAAEKKDAQGVGGGDDGGDGGGNGGANPPPFYVRLKVPGLDWYQYHFGLDDITGSHTYSGINPAKCQQTITAELYDSHGTPGEGDDILLTNTSVSVTVT